MAGKIIRKPSFQFALTFIHRENRTRIINCFDMSFNHFHGHRSVARLMEINACNRLIGIYVNFIFFAPNVSIIAID